MSRYTTEFRFLLENPEWTDDRLGLANYPIFNEEYRTPLNNLIKKHYYFDEIGQETPARFAQRLDAKLSLIMPYYNQLYLSAMEKINPFINQNYTNVTNDIIKKVIELINTVDETSQTAGKNSGGKDNISVGNETSDFLSDKVGKNNTTRKSNNSGVVSENNNNVKNESSLQDNITNVTENTDYKGGEVNTKTGSKTNQKTGNDDKIYSGLEKTTIIPNTTETAETNNLGGDKTSFSVESDSPEGFVKTATLESDYTYASSARKSVDVDKSKNKTTTNKTGTETTNKEFNERKDQNNYNSTDTETYNDIIDKKEYASRSDIKKEINENKNLSENLTDENEVKNKKEKQENNESEEAKNKESSLENQIKDKYQKDIEKTNQTTLELLNKIIDTIQNEITKEDKNSVFSSNGFSGVTMSKMLMEWRETFINIDSMIIKELSDCFMCVLN